VQDQAPAGPKDVAKEFLGTAQDLGSGTTFFELRVGRVEEDDVGSFLGEHRNPQIPAKRVTSDDLGTVPKTQEPDVLLEDGDCARIFLDHARAPRPAAQRLEAKAAAAGEQVEDAPI
jgi:hypothetical protein